MIRPTLIAAALFSAACTPPATEEQPQTPIADAAQDQAQNMPQNAAEATAQDTCGASQYAHLVGTNIAAVTLPADSGIRVVAPDDIVTQDFRPDRINVILDDVGVVLRLECY